MVEIPHPFLRWLIGKGTGISTTEIAEITETEGKAIWTAYPGIPLYPFYPDIVAIFPSLSLIRVRDDVVSSNKADNIGCGEDTEPWTNQMSIRFARGGRGGLLFQVW